MSDSIHEPATGADPSPGRSSRIAFGDCELDVTSGELVRAGETHRLEPQPAKVLLFLLERAGQVVHRTELHRHLWGEGKHVEADQGLNYCIKELRNALGDSARDPRYIETLRRRGYRFLVAPEPISAAAGERRGVAGGLRRPEVRRRWRGIGASGAMEAAVLLLLLIGALGLRPSRAGEAVGGGGHKRAGLRVAVLPFEACGRSDDVVSRGIPATVISRLASLAPEGVEVVAATTSFAYEGRHRTAREIGRELRVAYVVEGTFHRVDGAARLDVRLVDTEADAVVWSATFPAEEARLDALASTVADGVAAAVADGPAAS